MRKFMIIKISFGVSFIEYFKFVSEVSKGTVLNCLHSFKIKEFNIGVILNEFNVINTLQRFIVPKIFSIIILGNVDKDRGLNPDNPDSG